MMYWDYISLNSRLRLESGRAITIIITKFDQKTQCRWACTRAVASAGKGGRQEGCSEPIAVFAATLATIGGSAMLT